MFPSKLSQVLSTSLLGWMLLGAGAVCGQEFPYKPIRIVTSEAGGGTDFAARIIAQGLTENLNRQVLVENRPGKWVRIAEIVYRATPDGYTLMVCGSGAWLGPLFEKGAYQSIKDFASVSLLLTTPSLIVVHPSVLARTVKEYVDLAKAKPGVLNYAATQQGSTSHLWGELFKSLASVDITPIFYKSSGQGINDVVGGQVQMIIVSASSVIGHIKAGRLRALAVNAAAPTPLAPGLPTIAETVPGYVSTSSVGMVAPRGTPRAIVSRLNLEVARYLGRPEVKERLFNLGIDATPSTPERYVTETEHTMAAFAKVIKDSKIVVD